MTVGEKLDTFVVGIARFALKVVADVDDLVAREECTMCGAHALLKIYMETDVRPLGQPLRIGLGESGVHVKQGDVASSILCEKVPDLRNRYRRRTQQTWNECGVCIDGFFDRFNPTVKIASVKIVLMGVSNDNQIVVGFAELVQQSHQRGGGAINWF
ncbi:hypothetical protein C7270_25700 [Burkholderia thailandensis]|nr:hypothetical protein [Burkholderia thailandensis]